MDITGAVMDELMPVEHQDEIDVAVGTHDGPDYPPQDDDSIIIVGHCGPATKCEHGNYVCSGDTTSRYCTGCNPNSGRIIGKVRRKHIADTEAEHELDAADYLLLDGNDRIAANKNFFAEA